MKSRLSVQLCEEGGLPFLEAKSRLDPDQSFLLPISQRPALSGLSLFTRLGRIHSLCWALAYGCGELAEHTAARFESDTLRYRVGVEVAPRRLCDDVWLADVDGVFDSVALLVGDRTIQQVRLAGSW